MFPEVMTKKLILVDLDITLFIALESAIGTVIYQSNFPARRELYIIELHNALRICSIIRVRLTTYHFRHEFCLYDAVFNEILSQVKCSGHPQ